MKSTSCGAVTAGISQCPERDPSEQTDVLYKSSFSSADIPLLSSASNFIINMPLHVSLCLCKISADCNRRLERKMQISFLSSFLPLFRLTTPNRANKAGLDVRLCVHTSVHPQKVCPI